MVSFVYMALSLLTRLTGLVTHVHKGGTSSIAYPRETSPDLANLKIGPHVTRSPELKTAAKNSLAS